MYRIMTATARSGSVSWFIIFQVFLLYFSQKAVLGEDAAVLNDEDWKTLGFNLVVLKDQIDPDFTPDGQPIIIQGSYHTATLQKYTKDSKCFQLLTIDCDMIEKGKMKDSVKISCSITVPNPDMKSTGIKIRNILTELSPGRFLFVTQGGNCHRRLYLTLFPKIINRNIDDINCKRYTRSEKEDRARGVIAMLTENVPIIQVRKVDGTKDENTDKIIDIDKNKDKIKDVDKNKDKTKDVDKNKDKIKYIDTNKQINTRYDDENIS